jgi:Flp pilus assembly protein TadG
VRPRVGDFVRTRGGLAAGAAGAPASAASADTIAMTAIGVEDVKLLETAEQAAAFSRFDIVIPVPSFGALRLLPPAVAEEMRAVLRELRLMGLVETPQNFTDVDWRDLVRMKKQQQQQQSKDAGSTNIKDDPWLNNIPGLDAKMAAADAQDATQPDRLLFRPLLIDAKALLAAQPRGLKVVSTAVDPAATVTDTFDASRFLLSDRMLTQAGRTGSRAATTTPTTGEEGVVGDMAAAAAAAAAAPPTTDSLITAAIDTGDEVRDKRERARLRLPPPPIATSSLAWGISPNDDEARGTVVPAEPVADTSRMTQVVTAAVTLRSEPAVVPMLLREAFALHGPMSDDDVRLQRKVHRAVRTADTDQSKTWAREACQICHALDHSKSSECPLHARRLAKSVALRERKKIADAFSETAAMSSSSSSRWGNRESQFSSKRDDEADDAFAQAQQAQQQQQQQQAPAAKRTGEQLTVSVAKGEAWDVHVDPNTLKLKAALGRPELAPFVGHYRIVAIGETPVDTYSELLEALNAGGGERADFVFEPVDLWSA